MWVKLTHGGPPFVLVTPYRPAEMWAERKPAEDVLNSFDAVVVQADCFADDLRSLGYRGEIRVLPYLPPACSELTPLPAHPPVRIGFLGRLVPDKNLPLLLRAFAIVRGHLPAELHLFGDGRERTGLTSLAAELRLGDRISFHGSVFHADVPAAIDSCHLFAFSSVTEGQPVSALEILSRGRPLVATPVGVFPELLAEPGFGTLAALDGAEVFAESLLRVAREVTEGTLTPAIVQGTYRDKLSRERVLEEYLSVFTALARVRAACR
jgi:glycosyltransferase involved in cell wall biosynthesis